MNRPLSRFLAIGVSALVLSLACASQDRAGIPQVLPAKPKLSRWSSHAESAALRASAPQDWARRAWILKVSRALRAGAGLGANESLDELVEMSDAQVVDHFLQDQRFLNSALDFDLYYLGAKQDALFDGNGNLNAYVLPYPSAIHSTQELAHDGDFLSLLDFDQPFYTYPLQKPFPDATIPGSATMTDAQLRQAFQERIQSSIDHLISLASSGAGAAPDLTALCQASLKELNQQSSDIGELVGFDLSLRMFFDPDWYGPLQDACFLKKPVAFDWVSTWERIKARNVKLFAASDSYLPPAYELKSIGDIRAFDTHAFDANYQTNPFSNIAVAISLRNSSTNRNRKRAAYVLNRFFCDDLTPIAIEAPAQMAQGEQHASDPSCRACHYKLDPMAGFFKDRGLFFTDYAGQSSIIFDDQAVASLESFQKPWLSAAGTGRKWDIGFVRSPSNWNSPEAPDADPAANSPGENLRDLFAIIRRAPEARRCLLTRMFEYYVAEGQVIDPGYLDDLTAQFQATTEHASSSRAFKDAVTRLVTSQTFREPDPVPDQCYDFAPGSTATTATFPPCQAAALLQRNCAGCHDSAHRENGWLDLTHTIQIDGQNDFIHLNPPAVPGGPAGSQRPRAETLALIRDRLTSSDPDARMPKHQYMDSQEREKLYQWVNGQ